MRCGGRDKRGWKDGGTMDTRRTKEEGALGKEAERSKNKSTRRMGSEKQSEEERGRINGQEEGGSRKEKRRKT